jgi:hypothetical protein
MGQAQPTFNYPKRGGGRIMAQLFILSYSDAVSFRDIRGHLGTISSIVTFYQYNVCQDVTYQ